MSSDSNSDIPQKTRISRARIFARILSAQQRPPQVTDADRAAVADYLGSHMLGPRPRIEGDLKIRFGAMAERMSSTVDEVSRLTDAPAAVARYLRMHKIEPRAVLWPRIAHLDWAAADIQVEARPPRRDEAEGSDLIGITDTFCAVAETGTLVLLSGPDMSASTHLLPETHIALVAGARIVATMEDAFSLLRAERKEMPQAINLVSGPSRTGDIEQTIVLGAHGPYRVHIIITSD